MFGIMFFEVFQAQSIYSTETSLEEVQSVVLER